MTDVLLQQAANHHAKPTPYVFELLDRYEQLLSKHRLENPDLYRMVEEKKLILSKDTNDTKIIAPLILASQIENKVSEPKESIYFKQTQQDQLKVKIATNQKYIRESIAATESAIIPRTQSRNAKQPYDSMESMMADRSDKLQVQIQAWRSLLPVLIRRFTKISDPRRVKSVKHKLAVVMLYGLFAFVFRLSSRREINRELTGRVIFENLKKIFPELESIPHADTLARVLEKINVNEIERAHILLIN